MFAPPQIDILNSFAMVNDVCSFVSQQMFSSALTDVLLCTASTCAGMLVIQMLQIVDHLVIVQLMVVSWLVPHGPVLRRLIPML